MVSTRARTDPEHQPDPYITDPKASFVGCTTGPPDWQADLRSGHAYVRPSRPPCAKPGFRVMTQGSPNSCGRGPIPSGPFLGPFTVRPTTVTKAELFLALYTVNFCPSNNRSTACYFLLNKRAVTSNNGGTKILGYTWDLPYGFGFPTM